MNQTGTGFSELELALQMGSKQVDAVLERLLPPPGGLQCRVQDAMRYAIFAGGKRLRPFLLMQSACLFGVAPVQALRAAAAIEAVHTYSLVHDDLPCMDDDDLRRGRPTTHRAFDEATAVLAGDALLTIAFEIVADPDTHPSGEVRARLVAELARASGTLGMIGGQTIDIEAPSHAFGADEVILLQRLKTGALFEFCCVAGPILAEAGGEHEERLRAYARAFGLVFQITDDLLDVLSTAEKTGKAVGKDAKQGKATLVSLVGIEAARARAEDLAVQAAEIVAPYGAPANSLQALPKYLLTREA
ncbi:MAG: polyprenyl synthetase family protein [Alphaproteobacteria bacterium]|nr:polyprenyl synthetase family protein [Alphaproteobacteria bacterium]